MTKRQKELATIGALMALKTAQADGDDEAVRSAIDLLTSLYGIPADYPPHD